MKNRDCEYIDKLADYYAKHHVLPSYSTIGELIGLNSTSSVSAFVKRMKDLDFLASTSDRRLQPGKRFFERQIVDTVKAGFPRPANDVGSEAISIDNYLIQQPSKTFLFDVEGDSMIDASLLEGDIVVVKKNAPADIGDIVLAIIDGEFSLKFLAKDCDGFYLKPGNDNYPIFRPVEHLELFGLVVGLFRKYR